MRRFVTFLGAIGCVLLVVGGCARTVTVPVAEVEVAAPAPIVVVTSSADGGVGSLRQAVADAPANAIITFDTTVTEVALTSGSLVLNKDLTILGPEGGTVTIRGNGTFTVVHVPVASVAVVLENLTITGGLADGFNGYGGGIRVDWPWPWVAEPPSLSLRRCTVTGNEASDGGGLYVEGDLTIDASTVSANAATGNTGGGITYYGTDVDAVGTYVATATIRNSTITGNTALLGGAGVDNLSGEMRVLFSTITGNETTNSNQGGGILTSEDAVTRTVLKGTIVVGNTSFDRGVNADDVSGGGTSLHYESLGYNVIGAAGHHVDFDVQFKAPGDLTGVTDAGLEGLDANGGPTDTHALASTSLAIGRIPAAACTDAVGDPMDSDQRGIARPQGANCDAGAVESTEAIDTFGLSVSVVPTEAGSVAGAGPYPSGSTATLVATPAANWHFVNWSGDAAGTADTVDVAMDGNRSVTAVFAVDRFVIEGTVEPEGSGSVVQDPEPDDGGYPYGAGVALHPIPAAGWAFAHWNDDINATDAPWIFEVTGAMAYTAHFVRLHQLTLEVLPTECGDCWVVAYPPGGTYPAGTVVDLTAVPAVGWRIVGWTGADTVDGASATVAMSADKTVTATFERDQFTVTTGVDGYGRVVGGGTYALGATATLEAVPDAGSRFDHWSGDASGATNPLVLTVSGDLDVTAHFVDTHVLQVIVEGSGAVTPYPPGGVYDHGTIVTLTATADPGWLFQTWTGSVTGTVNPATVTMDAAKTVTAVFQPVLGPTLTVALDGAGHVTSVPEGIDCWPTGGTCVASFKKNTTVRLRATAEVGAAFTGWTGSVTGSAPDVTVRMNADKTVQAHFIDLNGPHVVISPTGSFRGSTAVVNGTLMCASGSHDLDVAIAQSVRVSKTVDQLVTASTTVLGSACGQPWTATLVAEFGRFARGAATVTVTIEGVPTTATVQLR